MRILNVYWSDALVGKIQENDGEWHFQYAGEWLNRPEKFPISISLPLRPEAFDNKPSRSFFANLLPESEIRDKIARKYGFSPKNDFELLNAVGGECAGALSIIPEKDPQGQGKERDLNGEYLRIGEEKLRSMIAEQDKRPLLAGEDGLRLSLAGAQQKLPVAIREDKIFLPLGAKASTHIIKPPIREFWETVENEAFCMRLAARAGLVVPETRIKALDDIVILIVQRYDREVQEGDVRRIHQEDFCQALGVAYDQKYESEGGPTLAQCFEVLEDHSAAALLDKRRLLEWVIFNYSIGNADAHAKNISLVYADQGIVLAPFYDLLSTVVYPELSSKMAMKVGGENRFDWVKTRHWQQLAGDMDIKPAILLETVEKVLNIVQKEALDLLKEFKAQGYACVTIQKIVDFIQARRVG